MDFSCYRGGLVGACPVSLKSNICSRCAAALRALFCS